MKLREFQWLAIVVLLTSTLLLRCNNMMSSQGTTKDTSNAKRGLPLQADMPEWLKLTRLADFWKKSADSQGVSIRVLAIRGVTFESCITGYADLFLRLSDRHYEMALCSHSAPPLELWDGAYEFQTNQLILLPNEKRSSRMIFSIEHKNRYILTLISGTFAHDITSNPYVQLPLYEIPPHPPTRIMRP